MSKVKTVTHDMTQEKPVLLNLKSKDDSSHSKTNTAGEDLRVRMLKTIEAMDLQNQDLLKDKCDKENEIREKTAFINELTEEYKTTKQKLRMYEKNDNDTTHAIEEVFAKIGRSVPDEYKKESEKRYKKMIEDMRKSTFSD
jgi:predicted transcriptional regulator